MGFRQLEISAHIFFLAVALCLSYSTRLTNHLVDWQTFSVKMCLSI